MNSRTVRRAHSILTVAPLPPSRLSLASPASAQPTDVAMNEIRIDRTGAHIDEYFELAGVHASQSCNESGLPPFERYRPRLSTATYRE